MSINTREEDDTEITGPSTVGTPDVSFQQSTIIDVESAPHKTHWKNKFLFLIERKSGISNINLLSFYISIAAMVVALANVNSTTQFLLQNYIHTPKGTEGHVAGDLTFYTEIVMLVMAYIWGGVSDALGSRKPLYVIGFALMAVGIAIQPIATSFGYLLAIRCFYGIGTSAVIGIYLASIADLTTTLDRAKAIGLLGLTLSLGSIFNSFVMVKLPLWISQDGRGDITETQAGFISFAIIGLLLLFICIVLTLFMHDGESFRARHDKEEKEQPNKLGFFRNLIKTLVEAITAMKDPEVALSYIAGFVSRTDIATVTFNSLWMIQDLNARGYSQTAALAQAGFVSGVATLLGLFTAPLLGILGDRVSRLVLLGTSCIFAALSFGSVYYLPDVVGWWVYVWMACMNSSNVAVMTCSNTLIAHSAPKECRGSVMGLYMLIASTGVMMSTKVGGILFDMDHMFPYLLVACCNMALFGLCILTGLWTLLRWGLGKSGSTRKELIKVEETPDEETTMLLH
jgi:MFS family permease